MNDVPHRPVLRAHLRAHVVPGVGAFLVGEDHRYRLEGAVYERLTPLLTGQQTTDEIVDILSDTVPAEEVYYALSRMTQRHLVRDATAASIDGAGFWDQLDLDPTLARRRVAEHPVHVVQRGEVQLPEADALLRACGLRVDPTATLDVVLTDDYLHPSVRQYHEEAMARGRSWIACRPVGRTVWIGPMFAPGSGPCWRCLAVRLEQHRPLEVRLSLIEHEGSSAAPSVHLPALVTSAIGMLATQLLLAIASDDLPRLCGWLLAHDPVTGEGMRHRVARRPQCPACGDPGLYAARARRPVILHSRRVMSAAGGGRRSAEPRETHEQFLRHLSPITGIVSRLEPMRVEGAPAIHVYDAGPNIALRLRELAQLDRRVASTNTGKGVTDLQARVSALGEAIERHAGVFQGDEPRVEAPLRALDGAIDPNTCMHFSDRQYAERDRLNAELPAADQVPVPLDPDDPIDWTPVWSLTEQRTRYLPTMLLYYDYPTPPGGQVCVPVSNGVAAGNSIEEAILHALLELIERDCVAVWWYNRLDRHEVDWSEALGPYGRELVDQYRRIGRDWWVLDLAHDLGVPCFAAVTANADPPHGDVLAGFGAHFDAAVALRRAVSEMNQVLAVRTATTVARFGPHFERWIRDATLEAHPHLRPCGLSPRAAQQVAAHGGGDLLDDIGRCRELLEAKGMEVLVLDQMRPDIAVPVVRAIVPPLRHFRARFAPGRLYTVPVEQGWRAVPLTEDELNPVPFPF